MSPKVLTIAVPKGRTLKPLARVLEAAGFPTDALLADSRALVREAEAGASGASETTRVSGASETTRASGASETTPSSGAPSARASGALGQAQLRFLLLKPDDVPTYVEYGAADLGVVGRDVLDERGSDVYTPLDLGFGRCRLALARRVDTAVLSDRPRVATKYPRTALAHFERKGQDVDIIELSGSVELAAVTHLADYIVDVVETGTTLAENGLTVVETVSEVSTMLIVNRAVYKLRAEVISDLISKLERAIQA